MSAQSLRRIVTGHDANGKAIILEDAPPTRSAQVGGELRIEGRLPGADVYHDRFFS